MLLRVPAVLTADQVAQCRRRLDDAAWVDGRVTAGHQSALTKNNTQVPEDHPVAVELGDMIGQALARHDLFVSAAVPIKIFPPLFNRYGIGDTFGIHVDNAIRKVPGSPQRVRTDLSATLFLTAPEDYDGGELVIEDTYGTHAVKLPAGDMILYPAGSLHRVTPITRGTRVCSFFWIQSLIKDDGERSLLFELDTAIQELGRVDRENPVAVRLIGIYHNLLRRWSEV